MGTLRDYNPVAREEFYGELRLVSGGADLHDFAAGVIKILRQSVDTQFSAGRAKKLTDLTAQRGKADLAGFIEIREEALNAAIDYATACEISLKLSSSVTKEKLAVLKTLFSIGTEVEALRHAIGRGEREVLSYWYNQIPDINGQLIRTMTPLFGSFRVNFEIARHRVLLEACQFADREDFYAKMRESEIASAILDKYYDSQADVMYGDVKKLAGSYSSREEITAKLHDLEGKLGAAQAEKRKALEEYRTADQAAYGILLLLDKILEYDNLVDHRLAQGFIYWRDPIAFNRVMRSVGSEDLIGLIRDPERALLKLEQNGRAFDEIAASPSDTALLGEISDYAGRLKRYTENVHAWLKVQY